MSLSKGKKRVNILSRQNSTIPAIVNDNAAHKLLEENTDDFFSLKRKELKLGRKKLVSTNIYASLNINAP